MSPSDHRPEAGADDLDRLARQLCDLLNASVDSGQAGQLPPACLQALLAALVRAHAARHQAVGGFHAFGAEAGRHVSATDVAITASAMLDAADMAVFELGMWQTLKQPAGQRP